MNKPLPHFCALVTNQIMTCGQAIINGNKSCIVYDQIEDRWYDAVNYGSLYGIGNYIKIQEVFWNDNLGQFTS